MSELVVGRCYRFMGTQRRIGKRIYESKPVVYNEEAVALAMLKPLTREEQELGQMSLFATTEREV